jgi:aspartyl-tRNA(Asn)/glutamyl-tRNA(Gln) amidotransferase subunit C
VAVSEKDVLHIAALARLGVDPARLPSLVSELNGILDHMEVLGAVETGRQMADGGSQTTATEMRSDLDGMPIPLATPREAFAPEMRDGFFLVPRLKTHEDRGDRGP